MKQIYLCIAVIAALMLNAISVQAQSYQELEQALSRAQQSGDTDSIAGAFHALGEYYLEYAPDSAVILCNKAIEFTPDHNSAEYCAILCTLSNAHFALGENRDAIGQMTEARSIAKALNDTLLWANAASDLGVFYRVSEQPDSAIALYNEALTLLENTGYCDVHAHLLTSVAIFYINSGWFDEAVTYARKAMERAGESNDIDAIMYAGSSGGLILFITGNKEEGIAAVRNTIVQAEKRDMPRYMLKSYAAIIDMHYKNGNRDSVDYYIEKGKSTLARVPEASVESIGFLEEQYIILAAYGKYRESIAIQQRILSMRGAGTYMPMDKLYLRIARNYRQLGDIDNAAENFEQALSLKDSLHNESVEKSMSEFSIKYKTKEKELEIATLREEKARQEVVMLHWIILAIFALIAVILIIAYHKIRTRRQRHQEELRVAQSHIEGIEKERVRLAKDLHDGVCNDLLGIGLMLQSSKINKDEALNMIEQVRTEVRGISHELMPPRFSMATLDEMIADFFTKPSAIKKQYNTSVSDNMKWENIPDDIAYNVYRIAQELLSNIYKHAGATEADVNLALSKQALQLSISHNGNPGDLSDVKSTGIGLTTIGQRLKSLSAEMHSVVQNDKSNVKIVVKLG